MELLDMFNQLITSSKGTWARGTLVRPQFFVNPLDMSLHVLSEFKPHSSVRALVQFSGFVDAHYVSIQRTLIGKTHRAVVATVALNFLLDACYMSSQ